MTHARRTHAHARTHARTRTHTQTVTHSHTHTQAHTHAHARIHTRPIFRYSLVIVHCVLVIAVWAGRGSCRCRLGRRSRQGRRGKSRADVIPRTAKKSGALRAGPDVRGIAESTTHARTQRHVFYPPSAPFPHTHTLQCPTAFSSVRLPACLPACARREHAFALERGRSPGQGGPLPSLSPGSFCVLARGSWPASARPASRSCPSVRPSVCVRHSARSAARVVSPRPPRQSHACLSVATRTRAAWVGHRVCLRYPGRLPAHRRSSP